MAPESFIAVMLDPTFNCNREIHNKETMQPFASSLRESFDFQYTALYVSNTKDCAAGRRKSSCHCDRGHAYLHKTRIYAEEGLKKVVQVISVVLAYARMVL